VRIDIHQRIFTGAVNLIEGLRISGTERRQSRILNDLGRFLLECHGYQNTSLYLNSKRRASLRQMCLKTLEHDKAVSQIERYLSSKVGSNMERSLSYRLLDIQESNNKLRVMVNRTKDHEFMLMDKLVEGELKQEAEIEERLMRVGPRSVASTFKELKNEVAMDSRVMQMFGNVTPSTDKLTARQQKIPRLQNQYATMLGYINRMNEYYANEVRLNAKIEELKATDKALSASAAGVVAGAGDMSVTTQGKKTALLMVLNDLKAKRLSYSMDAARVNSEINKIDRTFTELKEWYGSLGTKPKELKKLYSKTERLYRDLSVKSIERSDSGLNTVAQIIQRFESVPVT